MKENIPWISTELTWMVNFELKTHCIKFCDPSSKRAGAMGSGSEVINEKKSGFLTTLF